jgi:hypothetical protein
MAFEEDFTAFLQDAEFSVPATLTGGVVVQVIFDAPHVDMLGAGLMEDNQPTVLGRTVDLGALNHGAALSVNGQSWRVARNQPDGTGMTRLFLERVA